MTSDKSLKAQNIPRIWAVAIVDALILVAFDYSGSINQVTPSAVLRLSSAAIAPVLVLLLTSLIPAAVKDVLVFWRVKTVLPGHRAFSLLAQKDARIAPQSLRENVGRFPKDPREQNSLWYRLYKKVETDPAVDFSNRNYLLFRDIAALSAVLIVIAPIVLLGFGAKLSSVRIPACLFAVQYLATAIAARNHGNRLVSNVLALHSVKRY